MEKCHSRLDCQNLASLVFISHKCYRLPWNNQYKTHLDSDPRQRRCQLSVAPKTGSNTSVQVDLSEITVNMVNDCWIRKVYKFQMYYRNLITTCACLNHLVHQLSLQRVGTNLADICFLYQHISFVWHAHVWVRSTCKF